MSVDDWKRNSRLTEHESPEPMKVGDRIPTAAGQTMVITAIHPPDEDGVIRATAELERAAYPAEVLALYERRAEQP